MSCLVNHSKMTKVIRVERMKCKARNISTILPSGAWKRKTCFLIGGGPSLEKFDFSFLNNELSIGINKSFVFHPQVNYAMDARFYDLVAHPTKGDGELLRLHEDWEKYKGIKVFARGSKKLVFDPSVYYVDILPKKSLSFDLSKGIWPGNNSGFGALMLAIALGCRRIGLLGFDLKVKEEKGRKKTHWHKGYSYSSSNLERKLDAFRKCFEEFYSTIAGQGIKVVNLNPDSALQCFEKMSLENFLKTIKK